MAPHTVQQFFSDYFKATIAKGSFANPSDSCYLNISPPTSIDFRAWQFQQLVKKLQNSNIQKHDVASLNSIIIENNYLKYCLQKDETMKLCDLLDIHSDKGQSQNDSRSDSLIPVNNKSTSIEDEEIGFREDEILSDFLDDFLYLMEATKHLPVRTQNIIVLHFASEYREQMNCSSPSK